MTAATLPSASPHAAIASRVVPAAEFVNVSKTYRRVLSRRGMPAVRGVSLAVQPGEVLGLLGPNRAGKTTLVKMLLSLCRTTSGEVRRLGRPAADRATLARVGYVHENHAFPRYLGAATLLQYYGALSLVPHDVLRRRVPELLDRVGLADRSREPIARFSKGMLQRLGLAQALLTEPQLLVLDEPTEGLDLEGRQVLRGVVREVRQRGGSVLLVSHVLSEVSQLCDRVAVLVRGRLVHVGPLAELTHPSGAEAPRSLEKVLAELYAAPPVG
jgi:ABC-2 type transport system ATP-binding protein